MKQYGKRERGRGGRRGPRGGWPVPIDPASGDLQLQPIYCAFSPYPLEKQLSESFSPTPITRHAVRGQRGDPAGETTRSDVCSGGLVDLILDGLSVEVPVGKALTMEAPVEPDAHDLEVATLASVAASSPILSVRPEPQAERSIPP